MARIRTVKPELLEDEKTGPLAHDTWRLYVSTWLVADDYGNFRASPLLVHGVIFWAHAGVDVARMLRELGDAGLLVFYTVRGQRYAHITGWSKHQKVDHPGKPLCPGPDQGDTGEGSGGDGGPTDSGGTRSTDSRESREPLARESRLTGTGTRTKERTTERGEDTSFSGAAGKTPPTPADEPRALLTFPTVRGSERGPTEWHYTEALEGELRGCFPTLDVRSAVRASLAWIMANESNRKTARGMRRFVTNWLQRAQNRGENQLLQGSLAGSRRLVSNGSAHDREARNAAAGEAWLARGGGTANGRG